MVRYLGGIEAPRRSFGDRDHKPAMPAALGCEMCRSAPGRISGGPQVYGCGGRTALAGASKGHSAARHLIPIMTVSTIPVMQKPDAVTR